MYVCKSSIDIFECMHCKQGENWTHYQIQHLAIYSMFYFGCFLFFICLEMFVNKYNISLQNVLKLKVYSQRPGIGG